MNLLPSVQITFQLNLRKNVTISRLSYLISPSNWFTSIFDDKPYYGEITDSTFIIKGHLYILYNFSTIIKGIIQENSDGTILKIKIHINILTRIILSLVISVFILAILISFLLIITGHFVFIIPLIVCLGFTAILELIVMIPVEASAKNFIRTIRKIFPPHTVTGIEKPDRIC